MRTAPQKTPVAVIDTNVLISYLFGGATVTAVVDAVEHDAFIPAVSPYLVKEFVETVKKPKISQRVDIGDALMFMEEWERFALYVFPHDVIRVCRDEKDNQVLACAVQAHATYIITGDKDLLVIGEYRGISILSPAGFVSRVLNRA